MSKYNFGGGHLGFQDGRHAKSILLYSSPTGQDRHISGCTYICGVEKMIGQFTNCFAVAILKFKMTAILDLIWSLSPQRVVIGKLLQSVCVCVLCMRHMSILQNVNVSRISTKYTSRVYMEISAS